MVAIAKKSDAQNLRDLQKLTVKIDITRKSEAPSAAPPTPSIPTVVEEVKEVIEEVVEEVKEVIEEVVAELNTTTASPTPVLFDPVIPEEVIPEEVTPEEVTPEEVTPEEVTPEEVTPEEVTPEEVTPEEVISEVENVTISAEEEEIISDAEVEEVVEEIVETPEAQEAVDEFLETPMSEVEEVVEEILETVVPASTPIPEDIAPPPPAGAELSGAFSPYGADPLSTMLLCFVCLVVLTLR